MNKQTIIFASFIFFSCSLFAQSDDLFRVEYFQLPFSKSDNSISRYRALIQAPIPISREEGKYFVIGLEYRYVDINIEDAEDVFAFGPGNNIGSVQQMDAYLGYTWKWNEDWRIGVKAGVKLQSTLDNSPAGDDFIYDGAVYAIKTNDKSDSLQKPFRLTLGLTYSNTPGRVFPLPILNYYKEFRPNWTYTIGVPKSNIRYYMNDSHKDAVQIFATLDNFQGNIQNRFVPISNNPDNNIAENISMTNVLAGISYEHFFTENILYYAYFAHTVYNEFRLEDNEGETAYIINDENSLYFRTGLKYKF